jgi:hypothetical protein
LGTTRVSPARTAARALVQAGPGPAGAGEPLVEVDPVFRDAETSEDLALSGEVVQDGRAPGVADQFSHPACVPFRPPSPDSFADYLYETVLLQVGSYDA